jgi:hypothetical protein
VRENALSIHREMMEFMKRIKTECTGHFPLLL